MTRRSRGCDCGVAQRPARPVLGTNPVRDMSRRCDPTARPMPTCRRSLGSPCCPTNRSRIKRHRRRSALDVGQLIGCRRPAMVWGQFASCTVATLMSSCRSQSSRPGATGVRLLSCWGVSPLCFLLVSGRVSPVICLVCFPFPCLLST